MMVPEGWEVKKIADFAKVMGGKRLPEGAEYVIDKTEHPYIRVTDFLERTISLTDLKYIDHETHLKVKRYIISKEDVYISIAGTVGIAGVIPEVLHNANLTENAAKICEIKNVDKNFLSYQINSDNVQQEILTYIGAAVQPKLALFRIEKLQIKIPSLVEQQKIATILSTLDRTIEATQKLIDKEKMVKKGLMADLLTHGIDEQGRIRSPQTHTYVDSPLGMIPEGWEVKALKDVGSCKTGLTYTPNDIVDNDGILVLRSSNILGNKLSFKDNVLVQREVKIRDKVKENDILICVRNGSKNLIGKNALISKEIEGSAHGAFMSIFRTEYYSYVFQLFQSDMYLKQVEKNLGATINSINNSDLLLFAFPMPKDIVEQQKIATILSSQDRKIETEETSLAKLRNLKKGLMGDLLSGKVRVK